MEDEDEVLTALSDELGGFVEYVGGPEYGHVLLSPLENLATIEEPLVREKVLQPPVANRAIANSHRLWNPSTKSARSFPSSKSNNTSSHSPSASQKPIGLPRRFPPPAFTTSHTPDALQLLKKVSEATSHSLYMMTRLWSEGRQRTIWRSL